jgi:GxxExxY protein
MSAALAIIALTALGALLLGSRASRGRDMSLEQWIVGGRGYTKVNRLSERIIGCAFQVINTLGVGFLEKVYENALAIELHDAGLAVAQQHGMTINYHGITVGEYTVDLLVEQTVIVEPKAIKTLDNVHTARCLNYLKATGLHLCLLLNVGKARLAIQRVAHGL